MHVQPTVKIFYVIRCAAVLYCIALYCIALHCFVLHFNIHPLLSVKNAQTSFKLFFRAVYEEVLGNDSTATGTHSATDIVRLYTSKAIIH